LQRWKKINSAEREFADGQRISQDALSGTSAR
jgi:hypothetical protein